MEEQYLTLEVIDQVADEVRKRSKVTPRIGMILGSGLGLLADEVENPDIVAYEDLPGWPISTIEGHIGRLVLGELEGQSVVIMQGRTHYYEGYSMSQLGLPVRVMQRLGIEILFVTNAAGAIDPDFSPGELMLLTDHINFIGMDMVEVAPAYDVGEITALNAASFMAFYMGLLAGAKDRSS